MIRIDPSTIANRTIRTFLEQRHIQVSVRGSRGVRNKILVPQDHPDLVVIKLVCPQPLPQD
jgi:hypothetical protein